MPWSAWCWGWGWSRSAIRTASVHWCWASVSTRKGRTNTSSLPNRPRSISSGSSACATSQPGEAIVITARGELFSEICAEPQEHAPCIFEYVYFARPDSMIDNVSVHKARMRMGVKLGEKILRLRPDHDIDTIIPIPDTSRDAALEIANVLGVKYREGFIKNRYVGRTFIMPGQGERVKSVRRKLNPIPLEFRNRVVLLVDDSIVRGTTSQQIVQMARDAGARKVYLASAAPPVRHPNIYGIDMPAVDELVANDRSIEEIQKFLGCDWLIYQDLEDLEASVREGNLDLQRFDSSCFDGEVRDRHRAGLFRAHRILALGRGQAQASGVVTFTALLRLSALVSSSSTILFIPAFAGMTIRFSCFRHSSTPPAHAFMRLRLTTKSR